jgi:hypothetical protein
MPEPRVQRVQVHPLPFAFSTLWVHARAVRVQSGKNHCEIRAKPERFLKNSVLKKCLYH